MLQLAWYQQRTASSATWNVLPQCQKNEFLKPGISDHEYSGFLERNLPEIEQYYVSPQIGWLQAQSENGRGWLWISEINQPSGKVNCEGVGYKKIK